VGPTQRGCFSVYATNAGKARRVLIACVKQYLADKPSISIMETATSGDLDLYQSAAWNTSPELALYGPNDIDGNTMVPYASLDELLDRAYLSRRDYRDVVFATSVQQ
jgi:hypothetical protein